MQQILRFWRENYCLDACIRNFPVSAECPRAQRRVRSGPQAISYNGQYAAMVGVDINADRLALSQQAIAARGIDNYTTLQANVEHIPLTDATFDHAIAIDIAEHVEDPRQLCRGSIACPNQEELLITFPAMHDFYTGLARTIGESYSKDAKTGAARLGSRLAQSAHAS